MRHFLVRALGLFLQNILLYGHAKVTNKAVVTLQPNWPNIYTGETITLRCEIKNGGDTEWEYEWTATILSLPNKNEVRITALHNEDFRCMGRNKTQQQPSTMWSDAFKLLVHDNKPQPEITVSPFWLSPGDSVTLNCEVEHPSAGWRFYWYKTVPLKKKGKKWTYCRMPLHERPNGTAQDSYIVHGQTHTTPYVCRAGRGDPMYYTQYSDRSFVWSDFNSAASLTVNPDRVQYFFSESVSLNCGGNSTEWRVMRSIERETANQCSTWGKVTGPTCNINLLLNFDAVYWCESGSGDFSNAVNITVLSNKRPESLSILMFLFLGFLTGVLLIISLLLLYSCIKEPCSERSIHFRRTQFQCTSRDEQVNQVEVQQQVYSSLLEGDVCIYETIKGSEDTGNGP
ncbi:high affinity immunoglobulin gamma Fc receptor I-like [Dicentrarchus labrax]|uniref:high affinity immunoglobulin gamma Fc receptor I-like n=1 Tax=Dicentrarchus labrax TaxID=13489 RepID=UPI0021F626A9|nr:high affinity immunoglobulin gamma Fc receptor I-like [Dicentrarchus labrax]